VRRAFADLERHAAEDVSRRSLQGFFEVLGHLDELTARS
jgi:hypothetical protein